MCLPFLGEHKVRPYSEIIERIVSCLTKCNILDLGKEIVGKQNCRDSLYLPAGRQAAVRGQG